MSRARARRAGYALALALAVATAPAAAQSTQGTDGGEAMLAARLIAAYPEHLERYEAGHLVWKDGTRTALGPGAPGRSAAQVLAAPALADIFHWPYPATTPSPAPGFEEDPGRARPDALFLKMYGDCRKGEVARHLVEVPWLPRKGGGRLRVTRVNGVAERIAAASAELDALPSSFDAFLLPSAGAYHCRPIAGTSQLSAHGTGTAIDLAVGRAHYWRWSRPDGAGRYPYRNAVPPEIVRILERHGFIWGGKWYHYDTMHFEYRPELLPATGGDQPKGR